MVTAGAPVSMLHCKQDKVVNPAGLHDFQDTPARRKTPFFKRFSIHLHHQPITKKRRVRAMGAHAACIRIHDSGSP
ncbi:MAG: hypothetical protein ABWX87_03985, partial [Pseudoxanthomonas sp.]